MHYIISQLIYMYVYISRNSRMGNLDTQVRLREGCIVHMDKSDIWWFW